MDILKVINQLKNTDLVPYFNGFMSGIVDFTSAFNHGNMTGPVSSVPTNLSPAAYVMRVSTNASNDQNRSISGLRQEIEEHFSIIAMIPMTDLQGVGSVITVEAVQTQIFSAILNWKMEDMSIRGCEYVGDEVEHYDNSRYWHRFNFSQKKLITDEDGYQIQTQKLNEMSIDYGNGMGSKSQYN